MTTARALPFTIILLASTIVLKTVSMANIAFARADHASVSPPTTTTADPQSASDRVQRAASTPGPSRPPSAGAAGRAGGAPSFSSDSSGWDLLNAVQAEKRALDERSQVLAAREAALEASESLLARKNAQLRAMQRAAEQESAKQRQSDDQSLAGLVKVYETMRPDDAAAIFNTLELRTTVEILRRMKNRKAAPILGSMAPERARLATLMLAQLPNEDNDLGTSSGSSAR